MTDLPIAKLPIWKTTLDSYRVTFHHLRSFVRLAWPWLLFLRSKVTGRAASPQSRRRRPALR